MPDQQIDYERLAREARAEVAAKRTATRTAATSAQDDADFAARRGMFNRLFGSKEDDERAARGEAEINKRLKPKEMSDAPGVTNAEWAQWAASGQSPAELYPRATHSAQRKVYEDIDAKGRADMLKNWALTMGTYGGGEAIGALGALAGGEALVAGTGAVKAARPVVGALTRIGGNAALGAGAAAAEGGDWRTGAALGGGIGTAGELLVAAAPHIMEGAMRVSAPIARKFGKYGELGETAVRNRLLGGTESGAEEAADLITLRRGNKGELLDSAERPILTKPIADNAAERLRPNMEADWESGLRGPDVKESPVITRFRQRAPKEEIWSKANPVGEVRGPTYGRGPGAVPPVPETWGPSPPGSASLNISGEYGPGQFTMRAPGPQGHNIEYVGPFQPIEYKSVKGPGQYTATRLDRLKGRYDNAADVFHRASELGNTKAGERAIVASTMADEAGQAIKKSLGSRGEEYTNLNREIMNLKGVQLASKGRVAIPGRGLENMGIVYMPGFSRAVARFARIPGVMSRGALGANDLGRALRDPAVRAAILQALLSGEENKGKK